MVIKKNLGCERSGRWRLDDPELLSMRDLGLGGRARSRIVALRGAGADAGLSPSPAATRDLCSMNLEALRFSKRTGRKGGVTQKKDGRERRRLR